MPHTILIADDDASIRSWLARLLENAGHRVILAGTVDEARKAIAADEPDVLITDVRMGAFNGLQLVAMYPHVPAIVMTGHEDPVLEKDARQLGADFILKPLESSSLLRAVDARLPPRG